MCFINTFDFIWLNCDNNLPDAHYSRKNHSTQPSGTLCSSLLRWRFVLECALTGSKSQFPTGKLTRCRADLKPAAILDISWLLLSFLKWVFFFPLFLVPLGTPEARSKQLWRTLTGREHTGVRRGRSGKANTVTMEPISSAVPLGTRQPDSSPPWAAPTSFHPWCRSINLSLSPSMPITLLLLSNEF